MMDRTPTQVVEIQVNLDDASGERLGVAVQRLLAEGALDVWTTPIQMKKQRPGVMLCVLCAPEQQSVTARRVIELTGAFGVRYRTWDRLVLAREIQSLETELGVIRVKVGRLDGNVVVTKPEYDDIVTAAQRHGLSVVEAERIVQAAMVAWRAEMSG